MNGVVEKRRAALGRHELAWCAALLALVVNDHVLKGAGIVPSVVTGKLSDFAGLFVAPVLVAVVAGWLGARGTLARCSAFTVVAAVFCAVKLSDPAARALEGLVASFGIAWRVWADPTDLVGLVVFPAAWRTATVLGEEWATGRRRVLHGVAAAAGALGCLASSAEGPYYYKTSTFLGNATRESRSVEVFRATVALDCADLGTSALALTEADFELAFCARLELGQVVPLDRDFRGHDGNRGIGGEDEPACDAVALRVYGLPDTLVFWKKQEQEQVERHNQENWDALIANPKAVLLEQAGDTLIASGSPKLAVTDYVGQLPPATCDDAPDFDDLDTDRGTWETR